MPKTRAQKSAETRALVELLGSAKSVVFAGFGGLKVNEATMLRRQLRAAGVPFRVAKKTLLLRALTEAGLSAVTLPKETGGVALAFGMEDEVLPARLLSAFRKEHAAVTFQGGLVGGMLYSARQMQSLAALPSRQELLASLVAVFVRPATGVCTVLLGPAQGLTRVLAARARQTAS